MKAKKSILLFPCIVFASMFTISLAADPVLDTGGEALRRGVNYYIQPALGVEGGRVTLAKGNNNSCPYQIIQAPNTNAQGFPLRFSPANSTNSDVVIHVDDDITIKFATSDGCPRTTMVWQVEDGVLRSGGAENGTGASLFTIQRYEDSYYALQFCPRATGCSFICPRLQCGYIGIDQVDGRRHLAVNRPPFKIVFHKA